MGIHAVCGGGGSMWAENGPGRQPEPEPVQGRETDWGQQVQDGRVWQSPISLMLRADQGQPL